MRRDEKMRMECEIAAGRLLLQKLRRGVEKQEQIIADMKFRKKELEKALLEARRWESGARDASAKAERERCVAELAKLAADFSARTPAQDAEGHGYDRGYQAAINDLERLP